MSANTAKWFVCGWAAVLVALGCQSSLGQDEVFSGPQVGEPLAEFSVKPLFRDLDQTTQTVALGRGDQPAVVIFVHEVTRPAFALVRTVAAYVASLESRPEWAVVFLADDLTAKQQWASAARDALPEGPAYYVSPDGAEGPGVLGLNRHVTLTVVLARQGKVTANFSLVQPSDAADAPQVVAAIAELVGVEPPDAAALDRLRRRVEGLARPMANDDDALQGRMRELLGPVIRQQASDADIDAAAARVEGEAQQNEPFRNRLGDACRRIVDSGNLSRYGTAHAQTYLQKWADTYGRR